MNIIIPMNGIGKRFKHDAYTDPKPLIKVLGKEMIFRVIESLDITSEDSVTLIYNASLNSHNIANSVINQFRDIKFNFIDLKFETAWGPPTGILKKIHEKFPDLRYIRWFYRDEADMFCGYLDVDVGINND